MVSSLVVIHRPSHHSQRSLAEDLPLGLVWKTCLRQIGFVKDGDYDVARIQEGDAIYHGSDAYEFLLNVICGLYSPVLGETEVMGQFKEFIYGANVPHNSWGYSVRRLGQALIGDAKTIRRVHLKGMGSQSYGSLSRRHLKGIGRVSFLGSGQLVREMLPWFAQDAAVTVHCRNVTKGLELLNDFPTVKIQAMSANGDEAQALSGRGLIVAVPLTAQEIQAWIDKSGLSFTKIIDLRGDAGEDRLDVKGAVVVRLPELFDELETFRQEMSTRVQLARKDIASLVRSWNQRMECRPFGWDDLCA